MHPLALTASDAALWTTLVISIVTAIGGVIIGVIGALKGQAAQSEAKATSARVEAQSTTLRSVREEVHNMARDMPPTGTGSGAEVPPLTPAEVARVRAAISRPAAVRPTGIVSPQVQE